MLPITKFKGVCLGVTNELSVSYNKSITMLNMNLAMVNYIKSEILVNHFSLHVV